MSVEWLSCAELDGLYNCVSVKLVLTICEALHQAQTHDMTKVHHSIHKHSHIHALQITTITKKKNDTDTKITYIIHIISSSHRIK